MAKSKKKRKIIIIVITVILVLLIAAYFFAANFLVSACLVPSFMEKLDAFEEITVESYAQQVQTDSLKENQRELTASANEWFEGSDPEKISVVTEDGYTLIASLVRGDTNNWALVLHGYTGWKEEMYMFAQFYNEMGFNVIVPDLRCQGESEGDFIGMGYTDSSDCMLWLDYILSEDPDAEIILHGQSMGAATALIMSGREDLPSNVKAVVSDSSYTDAYSMFENKLNEWFHIPAFPIIDTSCLMLRIRGGYDLKKASAINAVKNSSTPTLFIHGTEDAMIPVSHAYELYDAAACEKELYIVENAGHGQTQDVDPEAYFDTIAEFCGLRSRLS